MSQERIRGHQCHPAILSPSITSISLWVSTSLSAFRMCKLQEGPQLTTCPVSGSGNTITLHIISRKTSWCSQKGLGPSSRAKSPGRSYTLTLKTNDPNGPGRCHINSPAQSIFCPFKMCFSVYVPGENWPGSWNPTLIVYNVYIVIRTHYALQFKWNWIFMGRREFEGKNSSIFELTDLTPNGETGCWDLRDVSRNHCSFCGPLGAGK